MSTAANRDSWYRQPVVWLGTLILAAVLAGCVWMIVMAMRYPDPPLDPDATQILKMRLERSAVGTAPR
ncbi:MAG: hypothetical protein WCY32_01005 [Burkholderiaceae bacterium]